jgi:hypothetical protein
VRRFCTPKCRVAGANARRASTRAGRLSGPTNPQGGEPSGRVDMAEAIAIPPSVDRSVSDAPDSRLATLMALAHSRKGVTAWEIAEIAKLRG